MAKIWIMVQGRRVHVDDSFKTMTPEEQERTVNEIASQMPQQPQATDAAPAHSGIILPISRDQQGNVSFDPNAGILGFAKRAFELPGQVFRGEVDPRSEEGIGRVAEMASVVTPMNPALRGRFLRPARVKPPTWTDLKAAGGAGFDQVRDMGVDYSATAVQAMATAIRAQLERDGILPNLAPKAYKILDGLQNPPPGSVAPLAGLEAARRALKNAGKDYANPTEQLAAGRIRSGLDEFVQAADPATVVAGPAAAAAKADTAARANYAAGSRSKRLNNLEESSDLRAASANSGQNFENTLRRRATVIVDPTKPKLAAGYSKGELALIRKVAEGTASGNTLRFVGNLLGGGGGLGATAATGVLGGLSFLASGRPTMAAAVGLSAPILGFGLKKAAARTTRRAFRKADEAVRKRSPLYKDRLRNAPRIPDAPAFQSRAALYRAAAPAVTSPPSGAYQDWLEFLRRGGA